MTHEGVLIVYSEIPSLRVFSILQWAYKTTLQPLITAVGIRKSRLAKLFGTTEEPRGSWRTTPIGFEKSAIGQLEDHEK